MKILSGLTVFLVAANVAHADFHWFGGGGGHGAGYDYKAAVAKIINESKCDAVTVGGSGQKVKPLLREFKDGVLQTFVRSLCRSHSGVRATMGKIATGATGSKDALNFSNWLGMMDPLNKMGLKPEDANLAKSYTLLLSLGMRESSGNVSEGADKNADNSLVAIQAAGLFQASQSSDAKDSPQNRVIVEYGAMLKAAKQDRHAIERICFNDVFIRPGKKDAVAPSIAILSSIIYKIPNETARVPDPDTFRKLMRSCPAAATEYSAVTARVLANHYGPLGLRHEVVPNQQCFAMMQNITQTYEQNSGRFCSAFNDPFKDR